MTPGPKRFSGEDRLKAFMSPALLIDPTCSGGQRPQPAHSDQVVAGHRDQPVQLRAGCAEESRLAQPRDGLQPAEGLLDQLAFALREPIAAVAQRSPVKTRKAEALIQG